MSEEYLVRNCAPTLAGLKTASLFTCPCEDRDSLLHAVRHLNRRLRTKGLRMLPLRFSRDRALLYLYRPRMLRRDLSHETAGRILVDRGYDAGCSEKCLVRLVQKLRAQEDFPHEIGLFLGYPPEDVCGFMENGAQSCKCVGCWKVYGDEAAARKKFDLYKKCTRVYCDQFAKGKDIERLTVAG